MHGPYDEMHYNIEQFGTFYPDQKGLMTRRGGEGRHPVSRGFEEPMRCGVKKCPLNNGTDLCLLPSLAEIGEDGVCLVFRKHVK